MEKDDFKDETISERLDETMKLASFEIAALFLCENYGHVKSMQFFV